MPEYQWTLYRSCLLWRAAWWSSWSSCTLHRPSKTRCSRHWPRSWGMCGRQPGRLAKGQMLEFRWVMGRQPTAVVLLPALISELQLGAPTVVLFSALVWSRDNTIITYLWFPEAENSSCSEQATSEEFTPPKTEGFVFLIPPEKRSINVLLSAKEGCVFMWCWHVISTPRPPPLFNKVGQGLRGCPVPEYYPHHSVAPTWVQSHVGV